MCKKDQLQGKDKFISEMKEITKSDEFKAALIEVFKNIQTNDLEKQRKQEENGDKEG